MIDRSVEYPNRYRLDAVDGETNTFDLIPVPGNITQEGTPISKATMFDDDMATRYNTDIPNGAFQAMTRSWSITVPVSGWSSSATNGFYTNRVTVSGMKSVFNPIWYLNDTNAATLENTPSAFANINIMETYDGYVIFKAKEVPDVDVPIGIRGV